jgi:hypothetical protein
MRARINRHHQAGETPAWYARNLTGARSARLPSAFDLAEGDSPNGQRDH